MFKKPFDFLLFTNSIGSIGLAREANIKRRVLERLLPKNSNSNKDT